MVAVDGGDVWADDSGGDGAPLVLLHPGSATRGSGSRCSRRWRRGSPRRV